MQISMKYSVLWFLHNMKKWKEINSIKGQVYKAIVA